MSTSDIELINFFIFNPKFGQLEGEEAKKILYYYPLETVLDVRLKNAGLCEALIKFTKSFNPDKPCHSFHTEKTKQFLYEAESDFWLVLTVSVPCNLKDEENTNLSDLVQDNIYEAVLKKSYRMYKIFCNTFKSTLDSDCSEEKLKVLTKQMKNFYNNYLADLKLANCDILDVFQGISFLPLGREPFLHVQSFINLVETKFNFVKYSAFLYNDQLVWSGINSQDMQMIYQYLVFSLLPSHFDLELQSSSLPRGSNPSIHNYGSFVTGSSIASTGKVPKVYLENNNKDAEVFNLVVYRALSATLCLFIQENESLTSELFKSLDAYLGPRLTALVSEVSEHCVRYSAVTNSNEGPKVLYFNRLNLAQKTTMHVHNRKIVNSSVPSDVLKMISELNSEKSDMNECGEVMMLTLNNCWLVGRYSNSREFYAVFTQKKGSLIDITEEVKKLCDIQLKGILFTE